MPKPYFRQYYLKRKIDLQGSVCGLRIRFFTGSGENKKTGSGSATQLLTMLHEMCSLQFLLFTTYFLQRWLKVYFRSYKLHSQFVATIIFTKSSLQSLFTIFVYILCLQSFFTIFVYNLCFLCLQSLSAHHYRSALLLT